MYIDYIYRGAIEEKQLDHNCYILLLSGIIMSEYKTTPKAKNEIINVRIEEDDGFRPRSTVVVDVVINGICHRLETIFSGEMVREEDDREELGKSRQDISFYQNGCLFQDGYTTANPGTYELEIFSSRFNSKSRIFTHEKRFREIEYDNDGRRVE
jgi:hypothetical protein